MRRRFAQEQRNDQAQHRATQGQIERVFNTVVLGNVASQRRRNSATEYLPNANDQAGGRGDQRRGY
ncbi:hypothetical protein D3C76_1776990 [compost metagenome]